ncbi:MAG: tetratricopeptide repeat protein [Bacteroidetes bacterium]|nr:tetratricopeptide repeat protein [Bacteroidota bacterium]
MQSVYRIYLFLLFIIASVSVQAQTAKTYFENGSIKFRLKKYDQAIADFTKAIELKPDFTDAYYFRALVKLRLKDSSSISDFTKTIELDPKNAKAYSFRGGVKFTLKHYQEALPDFDKTISLLPNYEQAYFYKGSCLMELKNYDESIVQLTKAIELKPDYTAAYYQRAITQYLKKDYSAAVLDFDKTAQLDSTYSIRLFYFSGDAKIKVGQKEAACADFKKSLDAGYKPAEEMIKKYCQ